MGKHEGENTDQKGGGKSTGDSQTPIKHGK
jgi:hypothetical protein